MEWKNPTVMKKNKFLLLIMCFLCNTTMLCAQWKHVSAAPIERQSEITKIAQDQGDGKILYGYCPLDATITSKDGVGFEADTDIDVSAAIRLSEGVTTLLKGRMISCLKVGVASAVENVTVFIRKADGTPLWETVTNLDMGWNVVSLKTPFKIPEVDELYIGYACVQKPKQYLIATSIGTADKVNGLFVSADNAPLTSYTTLGNLYLAFEVEGKESEFEYLGSLLSARSTMPYVAKGSNSAVDITLNFLNEGEKRISTIKLGRSFNGVALSDTVCTLKRSVRENSIGELILKVNATETGKYTYILKEIEGKPINVSSKTAGVSLYDSDNVIQRMVLIEEFTSQSCGNCPSGQAALHKVISGNEDRVAMVLHHSGFYSDIFSVKESESYCYFYNALSTYAPAMMLDRVCFDEYDKQGIGSPVFDPRILSKSTFLKQLELPSLVSVGIKSSYDESNRKLTVNVSGHKVTDLVGDYVALTVFLLESKYVAYQSNGGSSFEHNNFLRSVLTETAGDLITFNEDGTYSKEYVYTIPDVYVSTTGVETKAHPENMNIVAFVSNFDTVYPDNCMVLNANKTTSLNDEVTGLKSEQAIGKEFSVYAEQGAVYVCGEYKDLKVFNLEGMSVSNKNLLPGLYIVRITDVDQKTYVRKVQVKN